jgi:hypothetical protein
VINIEFNNENQKQVEVSIVNILGQIIYFNSETTSAKTKIIQLNQLSEGIYFLNLSIDGVKTIKKIVRQ